MVQRRAGALGPAHLQPTNHLKAERGGCSSVATPLYQIYLVLGHSVPIQEQELQTDGLQTFAACRDVENEALVEDGTERSLLHVGLLLGDALAVVEQVDFDVGVGQSCHVHFGEVSGLEDHHGEAVGGWLPTERDQELAATLGTNLKARDVKGGRLKLEDLL